MSNQLCLLLNILPKFPKELIQIIDEFTLFTFKGRLKYDFNCYSPKEVKYEYLSINGMSTDGENIFILVDVFCECDYEESDEYLLYNVLFRMFLIRWNVKIHMGIKRLN